MQRLLEHIEFRNPTRARANISQLEKAGPDFQQPLRALLELAPDPDESLHFMERLHESSADGFNRIIADPAALRYLIAVFSYSSFLSDAVIHHPEWILQCAEAGDMHRVLSVDQYDDRLARFLGHTEGAPSAVVLARFRRQQLLRILLRDVLRMASLSDVTEELSNLADAILHAACRRIRDDLALRHGSPSAGFSIISLGKLGGKELNYSSDIDLMFLYSGNGLTPGPEPIAYTEFYKKAANQCTELLSTYTAEGMCYRVDLRLRPDGRYGEICQSLEGAKHYYSTRARDWELQMLIKARVSAGDAQPGRDLLDFVEPRIYSTTLDFKTVESVSETRERVHEKLRRSPPAGLDIKLARGGIRDIEFLVQCLQRLHGGREPWVRHGGTLLALFRLRDKGLLSDSEYARLASAYQFLRHLEHRLQFDEDRQIHTLPLDLELLNVLARKMPRGAAASIPSAGSLERELDENLSAVQELYERVIHSQKPMYYTLTEAPEFQPDSGAPLTLSPRPMADLGEFPSSNLTRFLEQKAPRLAHVIGTASILRSRERVERFLEKVVAQPRSLDALDSDPELARCTLDLFENSQYFSDQLIRHPDLLNEVAHACGNKQGRLGFLAPDDLIELRRFFRQQMVRIQSDSVYHRVPIFKTLKRTSDLADSVVAAAYRIALNEAVRAAPPHEPGYLPANRMMVIALGRLGMREFDLASDADLVFVIPEEDVAETAFWTGVAERVIHVISAYTGDGVIFTVDTRLRPNGREGLLVQTDATYKEYFARKAEAWEGIAYMKARGVAGNLESATRFLNELQEVDWRRYGQSGRSRSELAEMRARLEKEQGALNPLKAGAGGYYDIDFALMYLRLKGAGIFYKVLNTPARIDIVEKMGHLEREDADFLRDAVTFYRAIDHGLRVSTGHAEGQLPTSPAQLAVLTELVHRWTPDRLHRGTLAEQLAHIRTRTRSFFDRLFCASLLP